MLNKIFSFVAPTRSKTSKVHAIQSIHDNNEDALRIIQLYNHGIIKTIHDEPALNIKKRPYLLKYRSSNFYVLFTAATSILCSVYVNCSLSSVTTYIIENQIKSDKNLLDSFQTLSDETISYLLYSFYLAGLIGGSFLFGWLGCQIRQRKLLLIAGTFASIFSIGALMVSVEYWMLFPAKFLQGVSNASVWLMCSALISDIWPINKLGFMISFVIGMYLIGMVFGLTVGALSRYINYRVSLFCAIALCSLTVIAQIIVVERLTIFDEWLTKEFSKPSNETVHVHDQNFKGTELEATRVMEEEGVWSKSSSMSTINLRDQPIIFDEKSYNSHRGKKGLKESTTFQLLTSLHFLSLMYEVMIVSTVIGALMPALSDKLEVDLAITNETGRNMIISTFLLPCACSSFASGWLSDRFGSKILGLTSTIISIPALIWIGVPNQDIQSVVSALVVGGITMAGIIIPLIFGAIQVMQKIVLKQLYDRTNQQQEQYLLQQFTVSFALICVISSSGFFAGFFLSNLRYLISFFWLCFCNSMLLSTCIPLTLYLSKSTIKNGHQLNASPNTRKKSIINSTRPASFAESVLSDDETTLGSPVESVNDMNIEPKSVIVMP